MRRVTWVVAIVMCLAVVLAGCGIGKKDSSAVVKDLDRVMNKLDSYHGVGKMVLHTGLEPQEYAVEVCYQAPHYYRISLTNEKKDITQIVLRNDDGVFVLTPHLNKSFRFQSDWPENQGQVYLYQSLAQSILMDNERQFTTDKDAYVFDVQANYQNGSLARQKVWLNKKDLAPTHVEVADASSNVMVIVDFSEFEFGKKFDKDSFDMQRNMTSFNIQKSLPTTATVGDASKNAGGTAAGKGTDAKATGGAAADHHGTTPGQSGAGTAANGAAGTEASKGTAASSTKTDAGKAPAAGATGAGATSSVDAAKAGAAKSSAGAGTAGGTGVGSTSEAGKASGTGTGPTNSTGTGAANGAGNGTSASNSGNNGAPQGNAASGDAKQGSSVAGGAATGGKSAPAGGTGNNTVDASKTAPAGAVNGTPTGNAGADAGKTTAAKQQFGVIEPTYIPSGVKKQDIRDMKLGEEQAILLRYSGKYNYTLVESMPQAQTVTSLPGDIVDLGYTLAVVTGDSKKTLTWTYDGIEFRLSTGDLPLNEMIKVAQAVQGQTGK